MQIIEEKIIITISVVDIFSCFNFVIKAFTGTDGKFRMRNHAVETRYFEIDESYQSENPGTTI